MEQISDRREDLEDLVETDLPCARIAKALLEELEVNRDAD